LKLAAGNGGKSGKQWAAQAEVTRAAPKTGFLGHLF